MFTGIVQDLGTVDEVRATEDGVRVRVRTALAGDLRPGDSIAVNGCCLTAVGAPELDPATAAATATGGPDDARLVAGGATAQGTRPGVFVAEVINESLRRTSLGREAITAGSRVNLELAMRPVDRLGGHVVQGHVDGVGRVGDVREDGFSRVVRIAPEDPSLLRYVVEKGSICLEGVSLTVSALDEEAFEVSLIPETLDRTTLGRASRGGYVNIEVDVLAKHVERLLGDRT